jgi:3-oxoacyl-[acyl-carrier protein] reductase
VQRLVERTRADYGDIGILVNAAGGTPSELYAQPGVVGGREGMLAAPWNMAESTWDTLIDANLKSVFLCTKAVIPRMVAAGRGDVVTIASQMGRVTAKMGGAYAVAKTGVIALTELFASAAATHGVRVNAVSPGLVDTPGQRRLVAALGVPLPNYDSADSVAKAVLYILCDAPKSMNGQSLDTFGI